MEEERGEREEWGKMKLNIYILFLPTAIFLIFFVFL